MERSHVLVVALAITIPLLLLGQAQAVTQDDIALYRPAGSWFYSQTQPSPTFLNGVVTSSLGGFGAPGAVPLLGDVDGNGVDDVVVIQGSPGASWYAAHSTIGRKSTASPTTVSV